MSKTTKQARLLSALSSGRVLTEAQIQAMGITNPSATVSALRSSGYVVYRNDNTYRMGTPTRELIAAGYRALALGV